MIMASWDDVRRIAATLPHTEETVRWDNTTWAVANPRRPSAKPKGFAWERPLRKRDIEDLGPGAPDGPILAVSTADVGVKDALIADDPAVYFTIPHFNNYAAVLVLLDVIGADELEEVMTDAWLCQAPPAVRDEFLASRE
jgi:hypothetical protein